MRGAKGKADTRIGQALIAINVRVSAQRSQEPQSARIKFVR